MAQGRDPLVIDVRSDAGMQVDARRIPGAISVQLRDIDAKAPELSPDREIVLYCNCPNEASAARAAGMLVARGLARARPLAGGLDAWVASGRPTDAVTMPSSSPGAGRGQNDGTRRHDR